MKIVEPKVEIITEQNPLKRIELACRTCYKSEYRITETSAMPFVQRLIARKHMTPLEHARIQVPFEEMEILNCENPVFPYGFEDRTLMGFDKDAWSINLRDYLAIGGDIQRVADGEFPMADDYMTARFTCDIGMSRELLRHRVFSACERSTRYVRLDGDIEFVLPLPFDGYDSMNNEIFETWELSCKRSEESYQWLIYYGASPQEARNVLPLSLKTELVMTGLNRDWQTLIEMRSDKAAHPQMQYLMKLLKQKMEKNNA